MTERMENAMTDTVDSTEQKHTAGPWTMEHWNSFFINDHIHDYLEVHSDGFGVAVVVMPHEDRTDEVKKERVATARLIAAAPELLEALRGVVRVADRATVEFDAARAAIAKATK